MSKSTRVRTPPGFPSRTEPAASSSSRSVSSTVSTPPRGIITGFPVELLGEPDVLGEGTFGRVLRYETARGRSIALKIGLDLESGVSPSLLREAAALSAIGTHPNIVRLLDVYITPTEMAILLPMADTTLLDYISEAKRRSESLDVELVKLLTIQLLRGLAWIHSKDLVHADVKTANILIYEGEGCPKCEDERCPTRAVLTDFGGTRTSRCFELTEPRVGGSPLEVPPEYALGAPYTAAGDIWALGCVIVEMLTNREPFDVPDLEDISTRDVLKSHFRHLGTPDETTWPGVTGLPNWSQEFEYEEFREEGRPIEKRYGTISWSDEGEEIFTPIPVDAARFVSRLLVLDPARRANPLELLQDPWLQSAQEFANEPCLRTMPVFSVDCSISLIARQAPMPVAFPYTPAVRRLLYSWLNLLQREIKSTDRVKALAIYIFERYTTLKEGKISALATELAVQVEAGASFLLASSLLDPYPLTVEDLSNYANGAIQTTRFLEAVRNILERIGLDLYIATSYDILLNLLSVYNRTTSDVAQTLLQLSYFSSISLIETPEAIALTCIRLATIFTKESFRHANRIERLGVSRIEKVEMAFGQTLVQTLRWLSVDVERVYTLSQRGPYDPKSIIAGIPILARHFPGFQHQDISKVLK